MRAQVDNALASGLGRVQRMALVVGIVGLAVLLAAAVIVPTTFFRSYLFAYVVWAGMGWGCLALAMLHHLTRGRWGAAMVRFFEAGMGTLPLLAVLFLPIILGAPFLYPWANADRVALDSVLQHQSVYLNMPFFVLRAVVAFGVWIGFAYVLRKWSLELDVNPDPERADRMRTVSAVGFILTGLTGTLAVTDTIMSLEPHWSSSIYAAMVMMGAVLGSLALVVLVLAVLETRTANAPAVSPALYNDFGSLLLAFVMLNAYLAFSQFLIMYAGNLEHEIPWYVNRLQGGWEWLALGGIAAEFALPFVLLLFRDLKRNGRMLLGVAALLVCARLLDVFWLVQPAFHPGRFAMHAMDVVAPVALGGLWVAVFVWNLRRHPLVPVWVAFAPQPAAPVSERARP